MTNTSMTPLEIAQQRIDECRETRSAELDLSQLGLDVIPDEVFELIWLENLCISGNIFDWSEIKEIPSSINKLTKLASFNCSFNRRISDLSPLSSLTTLTSLNCSFNLIDDLSPLRGLSELASLDCSYNQIGDLSPLSKLTKLASLDCGHNQVRSLSPLSGLSGLVFLNCKRNQISDLSPLSCLTALTTLECYSNNINDLSPLGELTKLASLNCRENQIDDLSPLSKLTELASLDCNINQINDLSPLSTLTMLTSLACGDNRVSDLSPLSELSILASLNCRRNQISDLIPITGLSELASLNCRENQVSDLSPLSGLIMLASLDCSYNSISELSALGGLSKLTSLDCRRNQISELLPLSMLTELCSLDCSYNLISELSPLSGLSTLASLNCSNNQISDLSSLYNLIIIEQLRELYIYNNPIYGVPSGILGKNCAISLLNYWLDIARGSEQHNQLKVQLIGNGHVGKTTLVDALEKRQKPDESFESTHGIILKNIQLTLEEEGAPVTLQLWDFGGQEIYHSTHRLFLSDDCLYLLLWAEETEEHPDETRHPVSYWLESIHDLGANSPVILIKNQIDRADRLPERPPELTDDLPGVQQIHQAVKISAFKYLKMNALRGAIQDVISELKHKVCLILPRSWLQVEAALETLKVEEKQKTIPFAHFKQLCIKAGVNDPKWLAGYLNKTGVLFYREGAFQNQIILDQNWAIEAIYKLFDPKKYQPLVKQMQGTFKGVFTNMFWPEADEVEREIYLDFMRNCGICYEPNRQRNTPFDEREFVIPALLPENCSAVSAWQKTDSDWQLEIKYTFLHRSIIDRIIMRIGEAYSGTAWRNGIFCNTENGQLLLECTYSNREASNQGQLTFHLRGQHLEKLLYALRKLVQSVSPHRRYQEYLQKGSNAEYEVLLEFEEVDNTGDPLEEMNVVSNTVKLFISYSHSDETPYRIELDKRLKAIQRKFPELQPWHDRSLLAGEKVHDKILQQLEEADIVVLLISPDFMNSDYCFSHEMEVALKQYEENKNIVIPVIIRTTADWYDFQIGNHTALPTDGKPLAKWDDKDEFWADVQTGISKQVERLVKR